jgi:calcineurin-like phosphoesterase family protein
MIYFTSDTHYGHKNIVSGISKWEDKSGCRNFKTLEEHNNTIVDSINSVVGQEDTLYHLGDWSFGGVENVFRFRERIICQNVHVILGNHDENLYKNRDNCHEVFESVNSYLELNIGDDHIVLSHWPMKIWNRYHKGSWHLHGHTHGNLKPDEWWIQKQSKNRRRTMDVGVDTNGFLPYSYNDLKRILDKLNDYPTDLDHHES